MNRLRESLLDVYRKLDVHPRQRGLITAELASDMVEMVKELISAGTPAESAADQALETLSISGETASELSLIHRNRLSCALVTVPAPIFIALSAASSLGVLAALGFLGISGGVIQAAGWFTWAAAALLAASTALFVRGVLGCRMERRERAGRRILGILAVTSLSLPFLVSAARLAFTDPLESVYWLWTASATLSTGFMAGILSAVMLAVLLWRNAWLMTREDGFTKNLDSILEELK